MARQCAVAAVGVILVLGCTEPAEATGDELACDIFFEDLRTAVREQDRHALRMHLARFQDAVDEVEDDRLRDASTLAAVYLNAYLMEYPDALVGFMGFEPLVRTRCEQLGF